jgi:hypothetical protein
MNPCCRLPSGSCAHFNTGSPRSSAITARSNYFIDRSLTHGCYFNSSARFDHNFTSARNNLADTARYTSASVTTETTHSATGPTPGRSFKGPFLNSSVKTPFKLPTPSASIAVGTRAISDTLRTADIAGKKIFSTREVPTEQSSQELRHQKFSVGESIATGVADAAAVAALLL